MRNCSLWVIFEFPNLLFAAELCLEDIDEIEVWDEQEENDLDIVEPEDEDIQDVHVQVKPESRALSFWLLKFVMVMQVAFRLSDTAVSLFVKFLKTFMSLLGRFCKISAEIAQCLPTSLYKAKLLDESLQFRKYAVCKKCYEVYPLSDCIEGPQNTRRSKTCSHQRFPLHPQQRMRAPCGELLLKTVELSSGKRILYPNLIYCYLSLEVSLQAFLNRPNFYNDCEVWRSRKIDNNVLRDIYDGKIWKDFSIYNNKPFLSEPGNLALMLNMDFFQPLKHVQYSVGAIYMTILNLPREVRNKPENVILVGLIPGPSEPRHDINSFLDPLVRDLLTFWEGIDLSVHSFTSKKTIRCALVSIACDLPAGRKVCGFLGHSAHFGCSRCWKEFPGSVGSMDYSGFDRENWKARSGLEHLQLASEVRNMKTQSDVQKAESKAGCRYSCLLKLPYFDAPRMLIVDPMHNLFLGSAKHFMKSILIDGGVIPVSKLDLIQQRVDNITTPNDVGRIPQKIISGFSSFTADQWKNWALHFSVIVLRDLLPTDVLECWRHFVLACRILSKKILTRDEVSLGDALLLQFCRRTQ